MIWFNFWSNLVQRSYLGSRGCSTGNLLVTSNNFSSVIDRRVTNLDIVVKLPTVFFKVFDPCPNLLLSSYVNEGKSCPGLRQRISQFLYLMPYLTRVCNSPSAVIFSGNAHILTHASNMILSNKILPSNLKVLCSMFF